VIRSRLAALAITIGMDPLRFGLPFRHHIARAA
jgi:hypothetical protein